MVSAGITDAVRGVQYTEMSRRLPISRLDCFLHRRGDLSSERCSFVACNPARAPGMALLAASGIVREGLGSQVAVKMALDHFVLGGMEFFSGDTVSSSSAEQLALEAIESCFRRANSAVYTFGHKLAAAGRMAAALQGAIFAGGYIAAGRVGPGSAYLLRGSELFPFFAISAEERAQPLQPERCVGAQSLVSVELASVELEPRDIVVMVGRFLELDEELLLQDSGMLLRETRGDLVPALVELFGKDWFGEYCLVVRLGEESLFLSRDDQLV